MRKPDNTDRARGRSRRLGRLLLQRSPKALMLVAFAYGLSLLLQAPFAFTASFLSSSRPADFDFADFYHGVADARPVVDLDTNIVVVNIDRLDRAEIAATLDMMRDASPRAVGIDILFQEPHEPLTDAYLIDAIRELPAVVLTQSMEQDGANGKFRVAERSFFADSAGCNVHFGASNLPSRVAGGSVREFRPEFPSASGGVVPGFASALLTEVSPSLAAELRSRRRELEVIDYPSHTFNVYTPDQLTDEAIRGKVVLLGAINMVEDMHPTPVNASMPGILIHAHALSTMLDGRWVDRRSQAWSTAIACLLCFFVTLGFCVLPIGIKGITLRSLQMALLVGVLYFGYRLYVQERIIIDFAPTLLMIGFGLFACDIFLGLSTIAKWIFNKNKQRYAMKQALTLLAMFLLPFVASAQYVVREVSGKVTVQRNGASVSLNRDAECGRGDVFNLPEGSSVSLLHTVTNKVYKAQGPATLTISQIVAAASAKKDRHLGNVLAQVNIGRSSSGSQVYEQNGMVRRSQAVLDPDTYGLSVEPEALAIAILNNAGNELTDGNTLQVTALAADSLIGFSARSVASSPVYFNVIKLAFDSDGKAVNADISELGQAVAPYMLQPQQELTREHPAAGASQCNVKHMIVATPCAFDIDELLDIMEELLESGTPIPSPDQTLELNVFVL